MVEMSVHYAMMYSPIFFRVHEDARSRSPS